MKRLTAALKKIRNPLGNPIIVKELRSRMRGARAFITLTGVLILMALISYGLYQLVILTSTWSYAPLSPQIGQTLFAALAMLEMLMICLITPAVTAGAISSEHEKLTYEMLLTTPLKPTRILWGKLISALSYIFLLVFAAIPMASLVFIYGGVAPREMFKALVVLISTAIMLGTIGIFMSTWLKRSGRAMIASYLIVLGMLGAPTVIYGIVAVLRQAEPPRWLLVPSPINALFSAIAPSTSLGNSGTNLFGSLSMLLGGNLGTMISADSIPRPLYHYTLPLYGLITLVLYLLATRMIRPARRWRLKAKEIVIGLTTILIFIGFIILGFSISMDRYENISVFAIPTPFFVEPMMEQAAFTESDTGLRLSDEEAIAAYSAVLQTINDQGLLAEIEVAAISRQTYFEPSAPELQITENIASVSFSDNILEGITVSADDLPLDLIWVDDFEALSPDDLGDPDIKGDVLILFSNLTPLKTGNLSVFSTVYYADQSNQNMTIQLANDNGPWEVVNLEMPQMQQPYPGPATDEDQSAPLSFEEIASIYTAAFLQAYSVDNPSPGIEISELYILQSTGLAMDSIALSPEVQSGISDALAPFSFEVIWVEDRENIPSDGAIVTFGHILLHDDDGDTIEVMIDFYINEGNSALVTYILQKIDGEWQITDFGGMG